MRPRTFGLICVLLLAGVCGGQPPKKPPDAPDTPKVFAGKVIPLTVPKGKSDPKAKAVERGVALQAEDGTSYALVEDDASRMLFVDHRLRNRPVRLTALLLPGTKALQVVCVQTVKDGKVYDVDYWCELCHISALEPGRCYCCGEENALRERPVIEKDTPKGALEPEWSGGRTQGPSGR